MFVYSEFEIEKLNFWSDPQEVFNFSIIPSYGVSLSLDCRDLKFKNIPDY